MSGKESGKRGSDQARNFSAIQGRRESGDAARESPIVEGRVACWRA